MSITLTNREAMNARDGLLMIGDVKLDVKAAYRIAKMKGKVARILEDVEVVRKKLLETHGARDADGKLIEKTAPGPNGQLVAQIELSDRAAFMNDFEALLAESQAVDGIEPLTATMLGAAQVTPDSLVLLGPLFNGDA